MIAWLGGLGIVTWRDIAVNHGPPIPGQLLGASGFFVLLSLLAEYPPAAPIAVMLGFGFDLAALLNILPGGFGGQNSTPKGKGKAPAGGGGGGSGKK